MDCIDMWLATCRPMAMLRKSKMCELCGKYRVTKQKNKHKSTI